MKNFATTDSKQMTVPDWAIGLGLGLATLALYSATLAPTVLEADPGEFQFVAWLPGIAHPTGYPLYVLLGWLWSRLLPLGEVAWRMNLLSAVVGAAAVGVTFGAARQLLRHSLPATPVTAQQAAAAVGAAIFAVTPTFWSQAIVAEVYSLHALLVGLMIYLALRARLQSKNISEKSSLSLPVTEVQGQTGKQTVGAIGEPTPSQPPPARGRSQSLSPSPPQRSDGLDNRYAWTLAIVFGLGLAHHRTTLLLLPALLLFLWPASPQPPAARLKLLVRQGLVAALPLLLYLYMPLIAPHTPYATLHLSQNQTLTLYDNSLPGFWQHITGGVFTAQLQPAAVGPERLQLTGQLLLAQVGWPGLLLALLGLVGLIQRRQGGLLLLTGLAALTLTTFNLIYFIGDVFVLFIPVWLIVCLWLALGILSLSHWGAARFVAAKSRSPEEAVFGSIKARLAQNSYRLLTTGLALFFFVLPALFLGSRFAALDQSDNVAARLFWQKILAEPLPQSAILISNDRNEIMPMWYYQYVNQQRPDLQGLFPLITTEPAYANVGRVLDEALASDRPVYLIKAMEGLDLKASLTPAGPLFRAEAETMPPQQIIDAPLPPATLPDGRSESITLHGYRVTPPTPAPGSVLTVTLHWQPSQPLGHNYTSYVHLLDSSGNRLAQSDKRPGGDYYPSSLWQPGETLRDRHTLTLPADTPPGDYRLRAGMYIQPEPGFFIGMGDGVEIGELTVE